MRRLSLLRRRQGSIPPGLSAGGQAGPPSPLTRQPAWPPATARPRGQPATRAAAHGDPAHAGSHTPPLGGVGRWTLAAAACSCAETGVIATVCTHEWPVRRGRLASGRCDRRSQGGRLAPWRGWPPQQREMTTNDPPRPGRRPPASVITVNMTPIGGRREPENLAPPAKATGWLSSGPRSYETPASSRPPANLATSSHRAARQALTGAASATCATDTPAHAGRHTTTERRPTHPPPTLAVVQPAHT